MKKTFSLILCFAIFFGFAILSPSSALSAKPNIEAEAAILIDMTTKEVLYEKNADKLLYPASTTKMITCLLAIENLDLQEVLTIDANTAKTEGNSIDLVAGEEVKVIDLLYAMMTESANDGAVALAKAISGSVEEFAVLMNARAKELGALNTNFVNPNGLHDDTHLSTAYDLAMIAKGCMEDEMFRKLVETSSYKMEATNKSKERTFLSTNRLLWDEQKATSIYVNGVLRNCKYDGAIGIKTGYTSKALGCLVAAAKKDGTTLLSVVLKSSDLGRFADSISLFDWGFKNYKTISVLEKASTLGEVKVRQGAVNRVEVVLAEDVAATVPVEASEAVLTTEIRLEKTYKAPIAKGQDVGELILLESGSTIASFPIIAAQDVPKGGVLSIFGIPDATAKLLGKIFLITVLGLFVLLIVYIIYKRRQIKKRKKERADRLRKKKVLEADHRLEWERQYESRYKNYED
ncbi:MAG: D-alanyl-D-alanine carboxypeptidase [Clostridia bacterium]|nr:D-alanyl-D-alanine carboxypeptidase [Clostridia bacterium]